MSHAYLCHVRFSDVDVYGHVNNVKYFEYYQEARLAFLTDLGGDDGSVVSTGGLVVARLDVDYKRPILFRPEPYVVRTWVEGIGRSSFVLIAEIHDEETLLSRSRAVMVAFDPAVQRSRPLEDKERVVLAAGRA
ncbi:acyl-CoA thioesterase [Nocardioides mesophilus]|uniref:Acyl-CoA thioesterase n=1 Tax=Nocardioides mesophilus TaxID=433659 RepID=A0A7G9RCU1_9ACTN|nr:thioesterase family protein [Nocardioides mesophilus]QNN53416.1 acyl-CoA thioesterase [Nocardioides mesophilus]